MPNLRQAYPDAGCWTGWPNAVCGAGPDLGGLTLFRGLGRPVESWL